MHWKTVLYRDERIVEDTLKYRVKPILLLIRDLQSHQLSLTCNDLSESSSSKMFNIFNFKIEAISIFKQFAWVNNLSWFKNDYGNDSKYSNQWTDRIFSTIWLK